MTKKNSITKDYMELYEKYVKQFGADRTIVLMQVGKFYEAYATTNRGPDLFKLEDITGAMVARKGDMVSMAQPYMWGFPIQTASKYMTMLIDNGYHLIVFDQVTPPPNVKRELLGIFSPATYIESVSKPSSNFIVDIIIDEVIQTNKKPVCIVGMSAIDVSTGDVFVHESYSDMNDDSLGLDECIRFINGLNPKEIIVEKETLVRLNERHIVEYLDLQGKYYQFRDFNQEHAKVSFQRKLFELIYSSSKSITGIMDTIGISQTIYARKSLTTLLTYLSDHYEKLISGIKQPRFYLGNRYLTLGNDAINQLNVVESSRGKDGNTKVHNLLDVLNKAATNMGKRYVKIKLVSPLTDPKELNMIYDIVEYMMRKGLYMKLESDLKGISDIERLERKLGLSMLNPNELVNFSRSFLHVLSLFNTIKTKNYLTKYIRTSHLRKKVDKMNQLIEAKFDIEKCKLYSQRADIKENIFKRKVFPDLDKMQDDVGLSEDLMRELLGVLDSMIDEPNAKGEKIKLKCNRVDGYYFHITKKRYDKLMYSLEGMKTIDLQSHKINVSDLEYKELKGAYKISAPFLKTNTDNIDELLEDIRNLVFKRYTETLADLYKTYGEVIKECVKIVTQVDYYYCVAKVARLQNYIRPVIAEEALNDDETHSYVKAEQIRHPIVEQIIDHEYIPHDIDIGSDLKGMMIYGLNAAGKSVLMKAIGLSVIMAQAGFFVPAQSFEFYPYQALYTRITGNDNLFRGLSSFSLEMVELNAILKRADHRTLVIGDEVCRGTEHISGNALVAATLLKLNELKSTFVFATHLHELMTIEEVKNVPTIKAYHLSVDHDEETDELIYDRVLKPGTGERIYGIIVAKSIIRNAEFINKALEIKNILLDNDPQLSVIGNKRSRYNAKLIIDRCKLCGKKNTHATPTPLEVHHINAQADCEDGFVKSKPHLKKNHLSNLIEICQECHDDIHAGTIRIKGYRVTSSGRRIIFEGKRKDLILKEEDFIDSESLNNGEDDSSDDGNVNYDDTQDYSESDEDSDSNALEDSSVSKDKYSNNDCSESSDLISVEESQPPKRTAGKRVTKTDKTVKRSKSNSKPMSKAATARARKAKAKSKASAARAQKRRRMRK
jgi:DNA mismatch repair protein MutS